MLNGEDESLTFNIKHSTFPFLMQVELPDGSQKEVPDDATVADVAASIGKRLAKDAVAGKVNGKVVDVYAKVPNGAKVEIVTPKTPEGLNTIRHSTAHQIGRASCRER